MLHLYLTVVHTNKLKQCKFNNQITWLDSSLKGHLHWGNPPLSISPSQYAWLWEWSNDFNILTLWLSNLDAYSGSVIKKYCRWSQKASILRKNGGTHITALTRFLMLALPYALKDHFDFWNIFFHSSTIIINKLFSYLQVTLYFVINQFHILWPILQGNTGLMVFFTPFCILRSINLFEPHT